MKIFGLMLSLFFTQSLFGYLHPCAGEWGVAAEFLYLKPSVDDTFYVVAGPSNSATTTAQKRNNDFSFTPGFRIEGAYGLCDNRELIVRYARLRSHTNDSASDTIVSNVRDRFFVQGVAGTYVSSLDLMYQNFEALLGLNLWKGCRFNVELQGGIEYAYMRLHEQIGYEFTTPSDLSTATNYKEQTYGLGPELGIEFNYNVLKMTSLGNGTLSFVSRMLGTLLVSKTKYKENEFAIDNEDLVFSNLQDDPTWRIVPAWHARLGLNYETCFSCMNASLEIGYEFHSYLRAISRERFVGRIFGEQNQSTSVYDNFDANGLYVALGLTF